MGVFLKQWVFPPNHPLKDRVFHYFHHPFWGTPIFGNTHIAYFWKHPHRFDTPKEDAIEAEHTIFSFFNPSFLIYQIWGMYPP